MAKGKNTYLKEFSFKDEVSIGSSIKKNVKHLAETPSSFYIFMIYLT